MKFILAIKLTNESHHDILLFQITEKSVALWTDSQYLTKADKELDCEWKLFQIGEDPSIAQWLAVSSKKF